LIESKSIDEDHFSSQNDRRDRRPPRWGRARRKDVTRAGGVRINIGSIRRNEPGVSGKGIRCGNENRPGRRSLEGERQRCLRGRKSKLLSINSRIDIDLGSHTVLIICARCKKSFVDCFEGRALGAAIVVVPRGSVDVKKHCLQILVNISSDRRRRRWRWRARIRVSVAGTTSTALAQENETRQEARNKKATV
jgi:hypothetical protein